MANPLIPGITATEQDSLYQKLNEYNLKKASFKEAGAYLVVLPRAGHPRLPMDLFSLARKAVHILSVRPERGHTRNLTDSKHPVLLLLAPPALSGIQRQADAEQG